MKSVQEAPLAHYVREYPALPGLQQAHRVECTLRRSDTMLCFSARRSSEAAPVSYYTAAPGGVPFAGCCAICAENHRAGAAARCFIGFLRQDVVTMSRLLWNDRGTPDRKKGRDTMGFTGSFAPVTTLFAVQSHLDRSSIHLFAQTHPEVRALAVVSTGREVLQLLQNGLNPQVIVLICSCERPRHPDSYLRIRACSWKAQTPAAALGTHAGTDLCRRCLVDISRPRGYS